MKKTGTCQGVQVFPFPRMRLFYPRGAEIVIAAALICSVLVSCTSTPKYPSFPPPLTKTLAVDPKDAFQIVRSVLNEDPRLVVDTIDNAGRFLAYEKTSGFIFFRKRTILDIRLQPVSPDETKVVMNLRAEAYESGGLTRSAGWYPVAEVNTSLGEDIMNLIERKAAKTAG